MALAPISSFTVDHPGTDTRTVQFMWGGLTQMAPADAVDVLVVSCLPGDYTPCKGSLIGALDSAGVSIAGLAQNKAASYEPLMPCWISQPVSSSNPGIHFSRILVYEPATPSANAASLAWMIYQALACFYGPHPVRVAMPLVSTGSGGADPIQILQALSWGAAHRCASYRTQISTAKVVAFTQALGAKLSPVFATISSDYKNVFTLQLPDNYLSYVSAAQSTIKGVTIPPTLTERQAVAVCIYTTMYYLTINSVLRTLPPTDPKYLAMFPLIEAIDSGLQNMTFYKGTSYRGEKMSQDRIDQYQVGAKLMNLAYTSSSLNQQVAKSFGGNALLTIAGQTAAEVWNYSYYKGEQEVSFSRDWRFQVDTRSQSGLWYFGVHELVTDWCGV
jgi:hypothetical protein